MANISDSSGSSAPFVRLGDRWLLLLAAFVYAAGVSVCVALSTSNVVLGRASPESFYFAGLTFAWTLGSAIGFTLLVSLLDVITRRQQQLMVALAIGLAAFATYDGLIQVGFVASYNHYRNMPSALSEKPAVPTVLESH